MYFLGIKSCQNIWQSAKNILPLQCIDYQHNINLYFLVMEHIENQQVSNAQNQIESVQKVCDALSDLINDYRWSISDRVVLVELWTKLIKVYWDLYAKCGNIPTIKL